MRDFKVYQASGYLTKLVTDASDVRKEYEEISGSLVQFDTPISAPLEILRVDINPVQSGSGDPSPDNVRPITGWTGCEVWVKDEYDTSLPATASVTFPDSVGTVYGGTVDLVSGLLTVTHKMKVYDGTQNPSFFPWGSTDNFVAALYPPFPEAERQYNYSVNSVPSDSFCNMFKAKAYGDNLKYAGDWMFYSVRTAYGPAFYFPVDTFGGTNTVEALNAYLASNPIQLCYRLETPIEIQLTPQVINALQGVNNIWADTGDVSVKYRTH